jgi:hypothetical protein
VNADPGSDDKARAPWLLYLIMWLGSAALMLVDILLVRAAFLRVAAWYTARQITTTAERIDFEFLIGFIDRALLFTMVVAGLAGVIVLEHHYRNLAGQQQLLRQGWKPVLILVGIGLGCQLVLWLL